LVPRAPALRGRPQDSSGALTAQRIRETATRLFYKKGFEATTIREISKACGLTPGAIYNHYRSKHDLLYSIVRWSHDELDRDLDRVMAPETGSPSFRLRAAVEAYVLLNTRLPEAARVANREYGNLPPLRRREIIARRRDTRKLFEELIADGVAVGEMAHVIDDSDEGGEVSRKMVVMGMINMIVLVAEWYHPTGDLTAQQVAALHGSLALQLVGVKPDTHAVR
jgi:AcrR family transcriptional regulator